MGVFCESLGDLPEDFLDGCAQLASEGLPRQVVPKKYEFRVFGVHKVVSKKTLSIELSDYLLWMNCRIGLKETLILIDDLYGDF